MNEEYLIKAICETGDEIARQALADLWAEQGKDWASYKIRNNIQNILDKDTAYRTSYKYPKMCLEEIRENDKILIKYKCGCKELIIKDNQICYFICEIHSE